jgi:hypothetical protein
MTHKELASAILLSYFGGMALAGVSFLMLYSWEGNHGRIDKEQTPRDYWDEFKSGWVLATWVFVFVAIMVFVGPYLLHWLNRVLGHIGLQITQIVVGGVVVLIGGIFFLFRYANRRLYGRVELFVAAGSAIVAARQLSVSANAFPALVTLVGCVYVATRGFINMHDATMEEWEERDRKLREHFEKKDRERASQQQFERAQRGY